MPTTRRAALAILAAPALLRPSAARAQLFSWRLGHTAPESFPLHRRSVEAAEEVREKTGGDMVIDVQAEGRLGSQIGLLNQVVKGGVELTPVTGQSL